MTGDGRPLQRGASLTTTEHVDPAAVPSVDAAMEDDANPSDVRRFHSPSSHTTQPIAAARYYGLPYSLRRLPCAMRPNKCKMPRSKPRTAVSLCRCRRARCGSN